MTTGGSGFSSGEDFIAAKVSIDVPTEGIQTLQQFSTQVNNFRTSVEAAARGSSSFVGYLSQMKQAADLATQAHQNLAAQLERTTDLQQRSMTGAAGSPSAQSALPLSRSAPQGYVDPFAGMGGGMGSQRTSSPSDVQSQLQQQVIDPTRQVDPRKYVNAQAGRFNAPAGLGTQSPGQIDWSEQASRVEQRDKQTREQAGDLTGSANKMAGLAGNLMHEMSPGTSHTGMMGRAAGALGFGGRPSAAAAGGGGGAETAQAAMDKGATAAEGGGMGEAVGGGLGGLLGGGLGGLMRGLGPVGAGLGMALGGVGLVEKGGAMYQGAKNMGLIRGGGAMQGVGDEVKMREMALNPFLSTEQSRQIIMAGLTEGYSGKQFDNVTQFMAQNLKDMNIQVADSVKMLRTSIQGGQTPEQATGELSSTMGVLKKLSKGGVTSLPDMQQNFESTQQALINQGIPAGQADKDAVLAGQMWNTPETRAMKGDFGQYEQSMVGSQSGQVALDMFGPKVPGVFPGAAAFYEGMHGANESQITDQALKQLVNLYFRTPSSRQKGSKDYANAVWMLQRGLQKYAPGSPGAQSMNKAAQLADSYIGGQDYMARAESEVNGASQGGGGHGGGGIGGFFSSLGKSIPALLTGNETALGNAWRTGDDGGGGDSPMNDQIAGQYGGGTQVVDQAGHAQPFTGSSAQGKGLNSGNLNWKRQGEQGAGYSLSQTPGWGAAQNHSGHTQGGHPNTNVNFSPAQVQISFTNGGMTASPNPVQLTPNQQAANSGVGSATMNNPPPGDGFGYYRGKFGNGMS